MLLFYVSIKNLERLKLINYFENVDVEILYN